MDAKELLRAQVPDPLRMQVLVTMRALLQRVNRRLAKEEKVLKKSRGREELAWFGDYYVLDYAANEIYDDHVDRLALARELGVLHGWERVTEEAANGQ